MAAGTDTRQDTEREPARTGRGATGVTSSSIPSGFSTPRKTPGQRRRPSICSATFPMRQRRSSASMFARLSDRLRNAAETRWLSSSGIEPSAQAAADAYRPLMRRMPHDKPLQPDLRSGNEDMHVGEGSRDDIQEAGRAGALVRGGAAVMSGEWTGWERRESGPGDAVQAALLLPGVCARRCSTRS
jgi:hypothetical protein